ncbi:hypothetical protein B0H19DRAFT_877256, partial [Mycena capillaripes]
AFNLHFRICMNSLSQHDVPRHLSPEDMAPFAARFATADDVNAQVTKIVSDSVTTTAKVYADFLRNLKESRGQIAKDARRIGDNHIRVIFNAIAAAGLPAFMPDVFGNEESLYNLVHEHLAIHTFRTIGMAWAYFSLCPFPLELLDDYNLLRSFYRSYAYEYLKTLAHKEEQSPGRVARMIDDNNTGRRR